MTNIDERLDDLGGGISRRTFVLSAIGLGALAISGIRLEPDVAYANEDSGWGGATGGDSGIVFGSYQIAYNWYDRGGFKDTEHKEPDQGFNQASANWWIGCMAHQLGRTFYANAHHGNTGMTSQMYWNQASGQALESARRRSENDLARIVGVGWAYTTPAGLTDDYWCFARNSIPGQGVFTDLLPRPGLDNDAELPTEYGWSDVVEGDAQRRQWRQYCYDIARQNLTDDGYVCVVVAVADDEPPSRGFAGATKSPKHGDWL